MASRSAEDVLAGVLRIAVGGQEKLVPTLPINATREWQARISSSPGTFTEPTDDGDWTAPVVAEFTSLTLETILDVVVAYDRTGALGGREWLEEHADPAQLYTAATQMAEVAFPFATNIPLLLAALVVQRVVKRTDDEDDDGSTPPSSTSGPSPTGTSTPGSSRRSSTRAS